MKCLCPKCKANIELELADIPEEGEFAKCTECSAGFLLLKQSFAYRALHKGDEITCAECGALVGDSIYCQSCHAVYPDFYTTESSSAAKKSFGKIFTRFGLAKRPTKSRSIASGDYAYGQSAKPAVKVAGMHLPGQPVQLAVILVLVLLLAGGGGFYWYQNSIETKYAQDYIRLLYSIKSIAEKDLKTCARISKDWKTSMAPNPPPLTKEELLVISRAKTDLDTLMKRLGDAPGEKYKPSAAALAKLYDSYKNVEDFTAVPSGSMDSYAAAAKKLEDEFKSNTKTLRAGLPEKLVTQLNEDKKKYKALQDL